MEIEIKKIEIGDYFNDFDSNFSFRCKQYSSTHDEADREEADIIIKDILSRGVNTIVCVRGYNCDDEYLKSLKGHVLFENEKYRINELSTQNNEFLIKSFLFNIRNYKQLKNLSMALEKKEIEAVIYSSLVESYKIDVSFLEKIITDNDF